MVLLVCCLRGEFVDLGTATRVRNFPCLKLLVKCNHAISCRHVLYLQMKGEKAAASWCFEDSFGAVQIGTSCGITFRDNLRKFEAFMMQVWSNTNTSNDHVNEKAPLFNKRLVLTAK